MGFFDGIVSTLAGGLLGGLGQADTNSTNESIAAQNNATSLDIAKNGMYYKVQDLQHAGLNPALAYNSGPINMPNLSTPQIGNVGSAAAAGASNANQAAVTAATIDQIKSQTNLNNAQAGKVQVDSQNAAIDWTLNSSVLKDKIASAGSDLNTNMLVNVWRQAVADNDVNTMKALNDIARSAGVSTFDQLIASSGLQNTNLSNKSLQQGIDLSSYKFPEAVAMSDFYKSKFGHDYAPYLHSAGQVGDIVGPAVGYLLGKSGAPAVRAAASGASSASSASRLPGSAQYKMIPKPGSLFGQMVEK